MENTNQSLIRLEDVTKYYTSEGGIGLGLHKVNASFSLGEFVVITGASGSGKTTLLNVITGMDTYEEGTIWINGEDSTYYGTDDYEKFRQEYISFIFQNYNLIDSFTVYKNVELALIARGVKKEERKEKVLAILNEVGLSKRVNHRVVKLSGGEKQRVAIARALASNAPIIACDEITGNLDSKTSLEIIALLRKVSAGKLVLLVSHDVNEALEYATRVIIMHDGSIDKDYKTGVVEEPNAPTPIKTEKVKKTELFKLSLSNLFSTPGKFVLLFITLLIVTGLLASICIIFNQSDSVGESLVGGKYITSMNNTYNNRIVVKKDEGKIFNQSDLDRITSMVNVTGITKNDLAIDTTFYSMIDGDDYPTIYRLIPSSTLKDNDLAYGQLPENKDEIVVSATGNASKNLVGKTIIFAAGGMKEKFTAKISGVVSGSIVQSNAYFTDEKIYEISQQLSLFTMSYSFNRDVEDEYVNKEASSNILWLKDSSLRDNQIKIDQKVYTGEEKTPTTMVSDLIINNKFSEYVFQQADITYSKSLGKNIKDDYFKEDGTYDYINATIDETYGIGSTYIYLSENDYNTIMELNQDIYQITVNVNKDSNVNKVVNALENDGFYCSAGMLVKPDDTIQIVVLIFKGYMILYCGLMFIGISAIVYAIIKNVIKTQQRNFLIMRSLGIDGKKIEYQVFTELLFTTFIAYSVIFFIWFIFQFRNYGGFFGYIHDLPFTAMLFVFVVMMGLTSLLAFRYTSVVVKSAIVNKDME